MCVSVVCVYILCVGLLWCAGCVYIVVVWLCRFGFVGCLLVLWFRTLCLMVVCGFGWLVLVWAFASGLLSNDCASAF